MYLYLLLLVFSVSVPFALSFDRKVQFWRLWKFLFPSIILTASLFIVIDIIFTRNGVWGFNPRYNTGIIIAGLPLEEWLFFIVIPYACLFIHYVYLRYSNNYALSDMVTRAISIVVALIMILTAQINAGKTYTVVYSLFTAAILVIGLAARNRVMNSFFVSFLIMLIPFMIVNGILTGTFIDEEVVWYNNEENTGLRIATIPVEDFMYSFSLVAMNLLITEKLRTFSKNP